MKFDKYFANHDEYAYCQHYDQNGEKYGPKIFDEDVADFVVKHLKFLDRFNPYKVAIATMYAHPMLMGDFKIPEGNWTFDQYFKTNGFGFWNKD